MVRRVARRRHGRSPRRTAGIIAIATTLSLVGSGCLAAPHRLWLPGSPIPGTHTAPPKPPASGTPVGVVAKTVSCSVPAAGADFTLVNPQAVGLDPAAVTRAINEVGPPTAASLRIYRNNCLIGRTVSDQNSAHEPQQLYSMTKSIVALVVGRAVTLGKVGVTDPIGRYLPNLDAAHGAITIKDLLTQTSGLRFGWANDLAGSVEDSVGQAMSMPFVHARGTHFEYAQTTVTTLLAAVERAVGEDIQQFAQRELFAPIGIARNEWTWAHDGAGNTQGYAWLDMTPVALARLGTMVIERGRWDGRQIIAEQFIADMSRSSGPNPGYGYLTMVNSGAWYFDSFGLARKNHRRNLAAPPDMIGFSGLFDQWVFMVPSLDLVIVRTGFFGTTAWPHRLFRTLLPGVDGLDYRDPGPAPDEPEFTIDLQSLVDVGELIRRNDAIRPR